MGYVMHSAWSTPTTPSGFYPHWIEGDRWSVTFPPDGHWWIADLWAEIKEFKVQGPQNWEWAQ